MVGIGLPVLLEVERAVQEVCIQRLFPGSSPLLHSLQEKQ